MPLTGAGINSYAAIADGTIDDGNDWALISPLGFVDEVGTTPETFQATVLTSDQNSNTFTGDGTTVVDGVALKVQALLQSPSGTFEVALATGGSDVRAVTCNVSDILGPGWHFFKFSSSITLTNAVNYSIRVRTSAASMISIHNTGSGMASMQKWLRTTSTGTAPQNGGSQNDNMYVCGDITGQATTDTRDMVWNITSNTNHFNGLFIGAYANVNLENTAATNYYIKVANDLRIGAGATLNLGTSSVPVDATSTVTVTLFSGAQPGNATGYGIRVYREGTLNCYGAVKTSWTTLSADAAASATSISVAAATGWANGDTLAFASTSSTASHSESKTVSSVAGTTIGVAALTNAHSGTAPYVGEVGNLTRNLKITGRSTTQQGFIEFKTGSKCHLHYTELTLLGANSTPYYGLYANGPHTFDFRHCAIHDFSNGTNGFIFDNLATGAGGITIQNCVSYNIPRAHLYVFHISNVTSVTLTSVTDNLFCLNTDTSVMMIDISLGNHVFNNNRIVSSVGTTVGTAPWILRGYGTTNTGTYNGNVIHSCASVGLCIEAVNSTINPYFFTIDGLTTWRNASSGVHVNNAVMSSGFTISNWTSTANTVAHLTFGASVNGKITLNNCSFGAGSSPTCPIGIRTPNAGSVSLMFDLYINNSDLGSHASGDISLALLGTYRIYCSNVLFGSTPIGSIGNLDQYSIITSDKHGQVEDNYQTWLANGIIRRDTGIFDTASPSMRITPNSASNKIQAGQFQILVPDGATPTVSIKVRRSVSGDGAAHNGNMPRLRLLANPAAGINADTTIATATSGSNGAFETLSGSVPATNAKGILTFVVDTDGTAGWVNVDDFATDQDGEEDPEMSYFLNGQPSSRLGGATGGGVTVVNRFFPLVRRAVI
jgi:hypothetical protein